MILFLCHVLQTIAYTYSSVMGASACVFRYFWREVFGKNLGRWTYIVLF